MKHYFSSKSAILCLYILAFTSCKLNKPVNPNVVIIYIDDLGYGDLSCYGAKHISTPNVDRLANEGLKFTNAYSTASISTPARYSLLTGEYHWRKETNWTVGSLEGVSIAPGDAGLIIDTTKVTLADVFKSAGYSTSVVGKWHLGLGPLGGPDWNGIIFPGPQNLGFDYSFLIPATGDRVPCVFIENNKVLGIDLSDPINVSYDKLIGDDCNIYNPNQNNNKIVHYTQSNIKKKSNILMHPSFGHDQSIVNGIPRIGYMTGGDFTKWDDENIAETITQKALDFIDKNNDNPFFLYFSTHDIHVPRIPSKTFAGKSSIGVYGDVLMQMDWSVGEILNKLDELKLTDNTIVIFTSDNGPVLNDGYQDGTVENIGSHKPSSILKGGKYSAYEGGTRVPFIIRWPEKDIKVGISETPFSQVDLLASLASIIGEKDPDKIATDSKDFSSVLLGKNAKGREYIVQQNMGGTLSIVKDGWKYIEPSDKPQFNLYTLPKTDMGNKKSKQLFYLPDDISESNNIANEFSDKTRELESILFKEKNK